MMETEIKLRALEHITPGALEKLDWSPYSLGEREDHRLRDVLLDTALRTITGRRHALRVREDGATVYLTLKGPGDTPENGRHAREERQVEVPPDTASEHWPADFKAHVEALTGGQPLRPLLKIRN